jgi:subtilisin family serine protease
LTKQLEIAFKKECANLSLLNPQAGHPAAIGRQRILRVAFLFCLCFHTISAKSAGAEYVEGEVIVTFKPSVDLAAAHRAAASHSLQVVKHFPQLSEHHHRVYAHLRSKTASTLEIIARLAQDPSVAIAEPNYVRRFCFMQPPNDAFFQQLWALQNTAQSVNGSGGTAHDDINFLPAYGLARQPTGEVVVAIIDSGLDYTHPDLAANVWTNKGEVPGNGVDDDANGYLDDLHGYDFADGDGDPMDSGFHGTHVAGTIAAVGNNSVGVIGVAFQAHIMALKASSDGTTLSDSAVIEAIQYATMMKNRGVNIVAMNASFGGGGSSSAEIAALQAAGDAGIVFCAAAGNNSANNDSTPFYPASYRLPNMIVVAATDQNDSLASFSDFGATTVDLAAPGVNIYSALPVSQAATTSYVQRASTTFSATQLTYSGSTTGITASIYYCGLGNPSDFPTSVSGNIALIQRGTLFFSDKVSNAIAAGARAAIIYNNVAGNFSGTLQNPGNWIPAISLSQADGQALLATLPATGTVVNSPDFTQVYQFLNGTSMATPHVSGAVAFAAINFPGESAIQRVQRVLSNVTPVPSLQGKVITAGRLNLQRIVDTDSNGLPDWWEQMYFGQLTGINPLSDPDHDGANNLQEFLADTNPTNAASRLVLKSVTRMSSGFSVSWAGGVQSRQYLQRRSDFSASSGWVNVFTNLPPTTNAAYFDLFTTNHAGFYRIQVER